MPHLKPRVRSIAPSDDGPQATAQGVREAIFLITHGASVVVSEKLTYIGGRGFGRTVVQELLRQGYISPEEVLTAT